MSGGNGYAHVNLYKPLQYVRYKVGMEKIYVTSPGNHRK